MMDFKEFKAQFDGLGPEEYQRQIKTFEHYLKEVSDRFYKKYTYCTGCKKLVKFANKHIKESDDGRLLIRCDKCNSVWFVRDKGADLSELFGDMKKEDF